MIHTYRLFGCTLYRQQAITIYRQQANNWPITDAQYRPVIDHQTHNADDHWPIEGLHPKGQCHLPSSGFETPEVPIHCANMLVKRGLPFLGSIWAQSCRKV